MLSFLSEFNWRVSPDILVEVVVAVFLGGLIGAEREMADKPAGWRTHMFVSGAAALLTSLAFLLVERFAIEGQQRVIQTDPVRVVEAIITGVSFLGAGTIFRARGEQVQGITTAASLLFSASIGIAVALRELGLAICVTVLAIVILRVLGIIESHSQKKIAAAQKKK